MTDHSFGIGARRSLFDLRLAEVFEYRDLLYLLVRRDFVAQYKQTLLGPAWHLIQPLMTTAMFTLVFGRIAELPTGGTPPFVFYLTSVVIWTYFSNVVTRCSGTLIGNHEILSKVYFPRLVMPLVATVSMLVPLAAQVLLLGAILGFTGLWGPLDAAIALVWFVPIVVVTAIFGIGLGLLIAALSVTIKDLRVLVAFGLQLAMYASAVVYPLTAIPETYRWVIELNPMAIVLELQRVAFLGTAAADPQQIAVALGVVGIVTFGGMLAFSIVERSYVDTV